MNVPLVNCTLSKTPSRSLEHFSALSPPAANPEQLPGESCASAVQNLVENTPYSYLYRYKD